jgi:hypothetical protein
MSRVGFEHTNPVFEQAKTVHSLDHVAHKNEQCHTGVCRKQYRTEGVRSTSQTSAVDELKYNTIYKKQYTTHYDEDNFY